VSLRWYEHVFRRMLFRVPWRVGSGGWACMKLGQCGGVAWGGRRVAGEGTVKIVNQWLDRNGAQFCMS